MEVSAIFVATITRRRGPGAKMRCCSAAGMRPKSPITSMPEPRLPSSKSRVSRMSRSVGMKTSTSPASDSISASSVARTAASMCVNSSSVENDSTGA